jgi:protoheme IX farnesyltransferase
MKEYINLIKPGITIGNATTAAAGFFLASKGVGDLSLLLAVLAGLVFVIGSACIFNNYLDRDIDLRMDRTRHRALPSLTVSTRNALILGVILAILGSFILWKFTNPVSTLMALIGFFVYVCIYTPIKRWTVYATLIGTVAGATSLVAGYTAVTNQFDLGAVFLFAIMIAWQMPHFYAIAIYRLDDYRLASIPVLPIKRGIKTTKLHMLFYVVVFIVATTLLTVYGFAGYFYLTVMLLLGLSWVWFCIRGFKTLDDKTWAYKMFRYSLVVLLIFSVMISINPV